MRLPPPSAVRGITRCGATLGFSMMLGFATTLELATTLEFATTLVPNKVRTPHVKQVVTLIIGVFGSLKTLIIPRAAIR
jgi:hypothetical protein